MDQVPDGIVMPGEGVFYFIVAPFNREEAAKRVEMSKEGFTGMVLSSVTVRKVVKHMLKHSPQKRLLQMREL